MGRSTDRICMYHRPDGPFRMAQWQKDHSAATDGDFKELGISSTSNLFATKK